MTAYVTTLEPDPHDTDRWADDPTLPVCALAWEGDCDGEVLPRRAVDDEGEAHLCDRHWRALRSYMAGVAIAAATERGR